MSEQRIQKPTEQLEAEIYAALKLIEQLYIDGYIPQHVYQSICNEYHQKSA